MTKMKAMASLSNVHLLDGEGLMVMVIGGRFRIGSASVRRLPLDGMMHDILETMRHDMRARKIRRAQFSLCPPMDSKV